MAKSALFDAKMHPSHPQTSPPSSHTTVPNATWCPWNYFRTSGDVRASYGSIVGNLQTTIQWAKTGLSAPGCWAYPVSSTSLPRCHILPSLVLSPSPSFLSLPASAFLSFSPVFPILQDMLEVGCAHGPGGAGDPGLTIEETRAHFGAWCIVSSPLILSHDVNNQTLMDTLWPIIANPEALAVNQAWDGFSGSVFQGTTSTFQFWNKPVGGGKVAVFMMNHQNAPATLSVSLASVPGVTGTSFLVRDIWARKDVGTMSGNYTVTLNAHDAAFIMVTPQ